MIKLFLKALLPFFILLTVNFCYGQRLTPINWHFKAASVRDHETTLSITASLAPGWHLYSQSLKEGGPIPTRFKFDPGDDYVLAGNTAEKGNEKIFYDDTYEMEIIWYTGVVYFTQRIKLNQPVTTIQGKVEYMTCNDEVCIPGEQEFNIDVKP